MCILETVHICITGCNFNKNARGVLFEQFFIFTDIFCQIIFESLVFSHNCNFEFPSSYGELQDIVQNLEWSLGVESWSGVLEWNCGVESWSESWNGVLDWSTEAESWSGWMESWNESRSES